MLNVDGPASDSELTPETFPEWFKRMEGRKLTKDEEEFLDSFGRYIQRCERRELSHQEKHLSLIQAYQVGHI